MTFALRNVVAEIRLIESPNLISEPRLGIYIILKEVHTVNIVLHVVLRWQWWVMQRNEEKKLCQLECTRKMDGKRQQEWDEEGERESETKEKNEKKKDNERWLAPVLTQAWNVGSFILPSIYSKLVWSWMGKNRASGENPIKMHVAESKWAKFESKPTFRGWYSNQAPSADCAVNIGNEWKICCL